MTKKKARAIKPRNNGTMTESAFLQFIRAALRNKSRWWKPRLLALQKARRKYSGPNKRQKWEFKCSICERWFAQKNVQVHHKDPVGSLNSLNDLPGFTERLFCEVDGLAVVCSKCHDKLTEQEKLKRKKDGK